MIRSPAMWTAALAAAAAAAPAAAHEAGVSACAGLLDRRLEVCVAYVADATAAARVPYYALARSPDLARVRLVRYRLESRYVGAARLALERQVARWPRGTPRVEPPHVEIVTVTVA